MLVIDFIPLAACIIRKMGPYIEATDVIFRETEKAMRGIVNSLSNPAQDSYIHSSSYKYCIELNLNAK